MNRRDLLIGAAAGGVGAMLTGAPAQAAQKFSALTSGVSAVSAGPPQGDSAKDMATILKAVADAKSAGRPARLQRGTYFVDSLRLPSGTDLDLNGAVIRQVHPTAGSDVGAAVRNADFAHGNSRIAIYNGTISLGAGARGRILAMENVQQLTLVDLTISKGTGDFADWMLFVRHAQDVIISGCTVTGGTLLGEDGIHLEACRRVFVDDCTVSAGDDAFAVVQQQHCPTVSSDIFVSNCRFASRSAYVTRLSVYPGEKHGIYGVRMADCTGTLPSGATGNAMIVNDDTGKGKIARVDIAAFPISSSSSVAGGVLIRGLRTSSFAGLHVSGVRGRAIDVRGSRTLAFQGCSVTGRTGAGGEGWWIENCADIGLVACSSTDAPVAGFSVTGARSSRVSFTACRATNAGTYGWALLTNANVRLVRCSTSRPKLAPLYDQARGRAPRTLL